MMATNLPLKLYIIIITSLLSGFFAFFPIADGDIFWHLAAGREILNSRHLLFIDPFSYTTPGIQWIDLHWLFQVLSYLTFCLSGYYGLLLLKAFIVGSAVFLLLSPARALKSMVITASLFVFCIYHFRYLIPLRPGIFTLLYLSSFLFLLEKYSKTPRTGFIITLIPLQILWNNTQGLFMIGPAVVALYIVGTFTDMIRESKAPLHAITEYIRTIQFWLLTTVFLTLCISGMATPYGIKGFLFPFHLLKQITPGHANQYSNLIAENTPLIKMVGTDQSYYVLIFAILCSFVLLSMLSAPKKTRAWHFYLFACFAVLAIMAQRNLILFLFATVPLLKSNLEHFSLRIFTPVKKPLLYGCTIIISLYVTLITVSHYMMIKSIGNPISPFCHPVNSTQYLSTHALSGNIFNADRYGGYLLWRLYPDKKVYIDTRLSMRDRTFFSDYISLLDNPEKFTFTIKRYDITAVVLPAFIPLYAKLIRYLYYNPDWKLVIADGSEALFVKKEQPNTPGIYFNDKKVVDSLSQNLQNNLGYNSSQIQFEAGYRLDRFIKNLE
jgi:hypothetical protein